MPEMSFKADTIGELQDNIINTGMAYLRSRQLADLEKQQAAAQEKPTVDTKAKQSAGSS